MSDGPGSSVRLSWEGGFRFESKDSHGHTLMLDAPQNDGDEFGGFMPGDMLLTALAGCSGIDVVNILAKQRQQVEGVGDRGQGQPESGASVDVGGHSASLHRSGQRYQRAPGEARNRSF